MKRLMMLSGAGLLLVASAACEGSKENRQEQREEIREENDELFQEDRGGVFEEPRDETIPEPGVLDPNQDMNPPPPPSE